MSLKFQRVLVGYLREAPKEVLNSVSILAKKTEKPPKYYAAQRSKAPNHKIKRPKKYKAHLEFFEFRPKYEVGGGGFVSGGLVAGLFEPALCKDYMLFVRKQKKNKIL